MLKSFVSKGALPARKIHVGADSHVTHAGDLSVVPGHLLSGKMVLQITSLCRRTLVW